MAVITHLRRSTTCFSFSVRTRSAAPVDAGLEGAEGAAPLAANAPMVSDAADATGGSLSRETRALSIPPPPPPPAVEVFGSGAGVPPPEWDTRAAADCTESIIESAIEVNDDRMAPPVRGVSKEAPRAEDKEAGAVRSGAEAVEAVGGWRLAAADCWRLLAASFASSAAYRRSTASALEMKTGRASCGG